MLVLQASKFSWLDFIDRLENELEDIKKLDEHLQEFSVHIQQFQLDSHENETLTLSYEAYMTSKCELYGDERIAGSVRNTNAFV